LYDGYMCAEKVSTVLAVRTLLGMASAEDLIQTLDAPQAQPISKAAKPLLHVLSNSWDLRRIFLKYSMLVQSVSPHL